MKRRFAQIAELLKEWQPLYTQTIILLEDDPYRIPLASFMTLEAAEFLNDDIISYSMELLN